MFYNKLHILPPLSKEACKLTPVVVHIQGNRTFRPWTFYPKTYILRQGGCGRGRCISWPNDIKRVLNHSVSFALIVLVFMLLLVVVVFSFVNISQVIG